MYIKLLIIYNDLHTFTCVFPSSGKAGEEDQVFRCRNMMVKGLIDESPLEREHRPPPVG